MLDIKKDHLRDYATNAFCAYAKNNKLSFDEVRKQIYNTALNDAWNMSPDRAIIYAEEKVNKHMPELLDIMAVDKALDILRLGGEYDILKAVEKVYFTLPDNIRKCDISDRVTQLSITLPASERSIYYWLSKARLLFAALRGLNCADSFFRDNKKRSG